MFKRNTTTVNTDTGEIKELESYFSYWDDEKGYLYKSHRKGLHFLDEDSIDCSFQEKGMLFELLHHTYKDSNILSKRTKNGIRPLKTEGISNILGLGKSQTYSILNKFIRYKIMARVKIELGGKIEIQYWLNPTYFLSGKYINSNLYFVFRDSLFNKIPEYIRDKFEDTDTPVHSINGKKRQ